METIVWVKSVESLPLTKAQRALVETVRSQYLVRHHGAAFVHKYEFKTFEAAWSSTTKTLALRIVSGRKEDEGTMAEVLCRDSFLALVGPKGSVTLHNHSSSETSKRAPLTGRQALALLAAA